MSKVYYNEFDPAAAAWLRELMANNLIAQGDVDERSIKDVRGDDLRGYAQCHFFAGIGIWSALSAETGGATTVLSGQEAAPVSPSRRRAKASVSKTQDISGPTGFGSLRSAGLTRYLVNRLQARASGSILYTLTWKITATPSGRSIYRLRASPKGLTFDSVFTGWPTATTPSGGQTWPEGTSGTGRRPDGSKATVNLEQVARLGAWTTPQAHDTSGRSAGQKAIHGTKHGCACLVNDAKMAGWATCAAQEAAGTLEAFLARKIEANLKGSSLGVSLTSLSLQALCASAIGSSAQTIKSGLLRPGHSRWLLRIPEGWDSCGVTAIASISKRRRTS